MIKTVEDAKAYAAELRFKADQLEKLDAAKIDEMNAAVQSGSEADCSLLYCRFVKCLVVTIL
jgi:hypothetical protein